MNLKKTAIFCTSFLITFVAFFWTLTDLSLAQTEMPMQISVKDSSVGNGKMTATVEVKNPNSVSLNNLLYTARLMTQDTIQVKSVNGKEVTSFESGYLIADQTSDKFSLSANGTTSQPISIPVSQSVSSGKFDLVIALFSDGTLLGSKTSEINLSGSGSMLIINSCTLLVDKVEYAPGIGPNVAPNGEILAKCNVTNTASFDQTVFPSGEYAVDTVQGDKAGVSPYKASDSITFEAGARKTVTFALPALEKPQVYEALVSFNDNNGNVVSNKTAFRWVVAGESSRIRSVDSDKSSYKAGETAKVVVGADPSMDLFWNGGGPTKPIEPGNPDKTTLAQPKESGTPLKNPTIVVTLKNNKGEVCGTFEQKVTAKPEQNIWPDQTLNVPVIKDCDDVTVEAQIKSNDQVLAQKAVRIAQFKDSKADATQSKKILLAAIAVGALLLVAGIVFWYLKKHKKNIPPPTPNSPPSTLTSAILVLGLFLFGGLTLSASGIPIVTDAQAANQSIKVGHNEVIGYTPGRPCPGPVWLPNNPQPQGSDGQGGCLIGIVSSYSWTTFNMLDTSTEISYANGTINAHLSGQFVGQGCVNASAGLIVRAYVNGSQNGVKINGQGPRIEYPNVAPHGGGSGTPFDKNITITAGSANQCGPLNVKIELIPFIQHAGRIASDPAEDQKITDADVPGWTNITYVDRSNCGGQGPCFGVLQKQVDAGNCRACNDPCTTQTDCVGVQNGCSVCRPSEASGSASQLTCQTPKQCNESCNTPADCVGAQNGCSQCLPNQNGTGKTCQPTPTCGTVCRTPADCEGAENGCTNCLPNVANPAQSICQPQPRCGTPCLTPANCVGAQNGCDKCINDGSGAKCGTCPAGMNYDPTAQKCVCPNPGETNPHGVCDGDKCTNVNTCGVTSCTTDKQCFAEEMCKCDGFEATQLEYPSTKPFSFDAFAKIEGTDIAKAIVEGIQFKMSESDKSNPNAGSIIAQSPMYTPEIFSTTAQKIRYKATWSLTPPVVKANKMYRVFAEIKCKPKNARRVTDAADPNQYQSRVAGIATVNAAENNLEVAQDDLQLKTLNFVKKGQTDSCRFLFFEYDAGIQ